MYLIYDYNLTIFYILIRFGYGTLEKTKAVWNRTRAAGIPFVIFTTLQTHAIIYKTYFKISKL